MRKILIFIFGLFMGLSTLAENVITPVDTTLSINEVTVTSLYRNNVNISYLIDNKTLISENYGQEPSHLFAYMPSVFDMNDNGTNFGYGYFRIRGLDQTRINVTLDGMPWNESEDYGSYFANSPDLMSSMHSIKVERGSSSTNNGTASSGGSINLESTNLLKDTLSYAYVGGGSYNTYKTSIVYNSGLIGKSAFHIKATQQQTDGFKDYAFNNSQAFTLKYGYFFNDNHSIDVLSMNGRHRNGQAWLGSSKAELAENKHANGNVKEDDDEWFQTINKIQYKGRLNDNLFLTASAYLQYQNGWYNMDLDNYMLRMADPTWAPTGIRYSYGLTYYLYGGNAAIKYTKNNLALTAGTNIYWYQREHFMNDRLKDHYANVDPSEFYDNTGYKNDINAFAAISYTLGKFNFGANIQYRYVNFRYKDALDQLNIDHYMVDGTPYKSPNNTFTTTDRGTNWNFINWGANIEYNFTRNMKTYVRYAIVNREPTRTDMFGGNEYFYRKVEGFDTNGNSIGIIDNELTTNKAERSYDVEAGYEVFTDKVKANVNLYYMYFKNERVLNGQYGLNGLPNHDTADKSYRMGAEISVDWNFFDNFHYMLNTSLSKNKITTDTYDNKTHILTPAFVFNNDIFYIAKNWKIGINNRYHSKMYIDMDNDFDIPEFLTFNIYGSYSINKFEFSAHVNNIFNRTNYYNATIGASGMLWFRDGGTNVFADVKFYF